MPNRSLLPEACRGHLEDDAGVLCLDWQGPSREDRHAHAWTEA